MVTKSIRDVPFLLPVWRRVIGSGNLWRSATPCYRRNLTAMKASKLQDFIQARAATSSHIRTTFRTERSDWLHRIHWAWPMQTTVASTDLAVWDLCKKNYKPLKSCGQISFQFIDIYYGISEDDIYDINIGSKHTSVPCIFFISHLSNSFS